MGNLKRQSYYLPEVLIKALSLKYATENIDKSSIFRKALEENIQAIYIEDKEEEEPLRRQTFYMTEELITKLDEKNEKVLENTKNQKSKKSKIVEKALFMHIEDEYLQSAKEILKKIKKVEK